MALGLARLRLLEREAGEEGTTVVAVDLVALCLVEGGENETDLVGRGLVELVALVCLYPVKATEEAFALEVEGRGTRRVEGVLAGLVTI